MPGVSRQTTRVPEVNPYPNRHFNQRKVASIVPQLVFSSLSLGTP
jgi:hypothetical protein